MLEKALVLDSNQPLQVEHKASMWRGYTIEYSSMPLPSEYEFHGSNSEYHYLANHDLIFKAAEMEIEGLPLVPAGDIRGKMTYIPQGRSFRGWAQPEKRKNSFTTLAFCPHLISEELELVFDTTRKEPLVYFQNEALKSSMLKLEEALKQSGTASSLYLEFMGLATILEASMTLEDMQKAHRGRGALSQNQMRLLSEYIRDNLTRDMTLEELARLTGMSRFHFSRSFKASFGESPIRYINRGRFKLAQELLRQSRKPVGEIARQAGFGSAQNFLAIFKKQTGMTPSEFRDKA